MPIVVVIRRLILLALLFLPQRYWLGCALRLADRLPSWRRVVQAALIVAAALMVSVLADRIFNKFLPVAMGRWLTPAVALWMFASTLGFFGMKAVQALAWLGTRASRLVAANKRAGIQDPGRRSVLRFATGLVGAVPFLTAIYGYVLERLQFEVVRVDIPVANLPPVLDGLKIVQISDVHAGDFMPPDEVRRAVDMANGMGAHLAVVTGDFLTRWGDPLEECIIELSRLRAPLGVWGCNGNHEIYAGVEAEAQRLFQQNGMQLLRQAAAQIHWNGGTFNLIGIDYQHDVELAGSEMPTLADAENLVRRDMPNILLSHNPNTFYSAAALGVELSLAGHTHGGQVNVEIVHHSWCTARLMSRFVAGLYELPLVQKENAGKQSASPAYLYVNRGLGTLGFPVRVGAPPEITLLTLRSPGPSAKPTEAERITG
ncbi:MAG TPA: metallophosphoesterase [Terracidiphilus sp.]|jgi:hypothetical protein